MSYAVTLLCIIFAINLLIFLLGPAEANAPMLAVLKGLFFGGNIDWSKIIFSWSTIAGMAVAGGIIAALLALSPPLMSGGFGAVHVPLIFAIAIFVVLALIPNFSFMGFPPPIDTIIYAIFGFMLAMSVYGLLRGE